VQATYFKLTCKCLYWGRTIAFTVLLYEGLFLLLLLLLLLYIYIYKLINVFF
ncbi:unnamed protein product, partial [Musa hybrid cultivar]